MFSVRLGVFTPGITRLLRPGMHNDGDGDDDDEMMMMVMIMIIMVTMTAPALYKTVRGTRIRDTGCEESLLFPPFSRPVYSTVNDHA